MLKFPEFEFPVPNGVNLYKQSMQLAAVAGQMKVAGWLVDRDRTHIHLHVAEERQARFRVLFAELTGIQDMGKDGQTAQIKDFFWNELNAPPVSLNKRTKKPKLDASALVEYVQPGHPEALRKAAAALYGFRRNGKTAGYCRKYLELSESDGRVHPNWNAGGTKTGRWSCTEPNIQQLSGRAPTFDFGNGPETLVDSLKDILIADPGFVLVGADYSALELYIQAYLSQAQKLIGWINAGEDLHMMNARGVLGAKIVPADATKKTHKVQREVAKFFFGFSYNASDNVTQVFKQMKSKMPALTEPVVALWRKGYFKLHPELVQWQANTRARIDSEGFIDTPLMGRRLYLPSSMRGYNRALNGQAQITAADLTNIAILRLLPHVDWENIQIRAQVHDSIILQCRPDEAKHVGSLLTEAMTAPVDIYGVQTKFVAEPDSGPNWQDMVTI